METRWLSVVWIVCGLAVSYGQVRVSGRAATDTNAPVANAAVTIRGAESGSYHSQAFTDPSGLFRLSVPRAGDYLLDIEASGFYSLKGRPLRVDDPPAEVAVTLSPVREFADSVDVVAAVGNVSADQAVSEQTLTGAEMLDIPGPVTNNIKSMMHLVPGVVQDNANGVHVNGGAENQTLFLMDGFNIGDPLTGRFDTRLAIEAVQTMSVETGAVTAEFGKGAAGVVAVNTRTGDDRIRYSATNFIPGIENNRGLRVGSWNPRFFVSGPIRRGRVWFSDSFAGQYNQTVVRDLPRGQDTTTALVYNNYLRVQANLTPANIISFAFMGGVRNGARTGLGALDPVETTVDLRTRQWFGYVKDQWYLGRGAVIETGLSTNRTTLRQTPRGDQPLIYTPEGRRGNSFLSGSQDATRDQFIVNAYLPSFHWHGTHLLKSGTDLDRVEYSQDLSRTGFEWLSSDQTPARVVTFGGNGRFRRTNGETAAYVTDSWRLRENLLLESGIRMDWDRLMRNWNPSPRIGLAWSPAATPDTRVSVGYAIAYDAANLQLLTRPLDQYSITQYYPPWGTADVRVQSRFLLDRGRYESPRFATATAAIDHRFAGNLAGRIQLTRRRGSDGLTYLPAPQPAAGNLQLYLLANARSDNYHAAEFTLRQTLRHEYGWLASYTRSSARSNAVIDQTADNPMLIDANAGPVSWDSPNRFRSWAYLPAYFKNWAVSYSLEYRTGFPFSIENYAGRVLGAVNSARYPTFFELNLHLERRFRFRGQLWAGRLGYNNITGHDNPNAVGNIFGSPQFLSFYGGQSRALQFRMRWLGKL